MPILPNNLIQLLVSYGTTDQNTIANILHLDFDCKRTECSAKINQERMVKLHLLERHFCRRGFQDRTYDIYNLTLA